MGRFKDAAKYEKTIFAVISITTFLLIWYLVTKDTELGKVLAGPVTVFGKFFKSFTEPLGTHVIPGHILWSLSRVMVGYVVASILGIILGVTMGWSRLVEAMFRPLFEIIRPIPPIAWIPLAILWFGLGELTKYFLIALATFSNVTMNAYSGAKSVDPVLIGAARMLGASDSRIFMTIVLPASVPHIFAGLQIALGSAWATVVAAEMVRSSEGVGWVIITGQDTNNSVQILVGIIAVGIIGYVLAIMMRQIEANLCSWSERGK
ncbi:MAG: hypothetical protein K0R19_1086 [Bacillota bacterium]|jgi:NitT/TauT family transport system permease protein/sulfonate transport system permease protein|nr:hypothetical protein [Bacillota bacterium]